MPRTLVLILGLAAAVVAGVGDAQPGVADRQAERALQQQEFDLKLRQSQDAQRRSNQGNDTVVPLDAELYDFRERQRRQRLGVRARENQKRMLQRQLRELQTLELDAKMGIVKPPSTPPRP